jgi:hypothetical protein
MANPLAESSSRRCQFSRLHDGHILISVTAFTLLWIIAGDRVGAAKIVTAAAGAEDIRLEIEEALAAPSAEAAAAVPARGGSSRLAWIVAAAAVLAAAGLVVPALRHVRESPPPEMRLREYPEQPIAR